jgi:hypothetical protein
MTFIGTGKSPTLPVNPQKAYKQRRKHRPCFTNNSEVKHRAF